MRFLVLLLLLASSAAAQTSPLFSQVDEMLASLSKITGWKVKHKIPSELLSRDKFSKLLDESVREAERDKGTRAAELTLKMFGLVPWDFNLARSAADLLEEQAAAFYDPKKKRLFVLESTPNGQEQQIALAHELAHALADQQFGILKYLRGAKEDDAATARQSVIEGQASWLSWAYMAEKATGRAEVPESLVAQLARVGGSGEDFPVIGQTPLYMRESLTFPYTEGMKFQDAVFRRLGVGAFERVFREPPLSTQEILHPGAYADNVIPTHPALPKEIVGVDLGGYRMLASGDVGEFDYSVMLRQWAKSADGREIATHWRGASYRLYEEKKSKAPLLVQVSEWDSPRSAEAFFRAYGELLGAKFKKVDEGRSGSTELEGSGDTGDFSVRILGSSVQVVEGIPARPRAQ